MDDFYPESEDNWEERESIVRRLQFEQKPFSRRNSLVTLHPDEEGLVSELPYDGGPYDASKYRIEDAGWDHMHCFLCNSRIVEGDIWWAALPPDEIGLCETCYTGLFGSGSG